MAKPLCAEVFAVIELPVPQPENVDRLVLCCTMAAVHPADGNQKSTICWGMLHGA